MKMCSIAISGFVLTLVVALDLSAQEQAHVRRLSDTVAVRYGPDRIERVLYYFRPTQLVEEGGEVQQGSSGHSEILLPEGGFVSIRSWAHAVISRLHPDGDVLEFPQVTNLILRSIHRPLEIRLPSGVRVLLDGTEVRMSTDVGRVIIRNEGGRPVEVWGDMVLGREAGNPGAGDFQDHIILGIGEEMRLPDLQVGEEKRGAEILAWEGLIVRYDSGAYSCTATPGEPLILQRPSDEEEPESVVLVGGVRARPRGEKVLVLRSERVLLQTEIKP